MLQPVRGKIQKICGKRLESYILTPNNSTFQIQTVSEMGVFQLLTIVKTSLATWYNRIFSVVASMYSWGGRGGGGGVGQIFPNNEKHFRIFYGMRSHEGVCYPENEDAIYKLNTHILRTDILQKHALA
jgi:hypothetical protein